MRIAGRPSWRFAENDAGDLHAALFVRDAGGLAAPAAPDIPPPLLVAIDQAHRESAHPAEAARQWVTWWRGLVRFRSDEVQPPHGPAAGQELHAWLEAVRERHVAAFDPPGFESLASMPDLRAVAAATFADGRRLLCREHRTPAGEFGYQVVSAAAEAAAAEFGVSPGEIDGTVDVLEVRGVWFNLSGPGYALCSRGAAGDPAVARQLLRAVFASRLR